MRRLHCPTCTCADDREPVQMDTHAPYFGLVLLIDRLTLTTQRQRFRQTLAERRTEGDIA